MLCGKPAAKRGEGGKGKKNPNRRKQRELPRKRFPSALQIFFNFKMFRIFVGISATLRCSTSTVDIGVPGRPDSITKFEFSRLILHEFFNKI